MNGVAHLFPKEEEVGIAKIIPYEYKERQNGNILYNLRAIRDGYSFMQMQDGKYVKLIVDGSLMMSDTMMERKTNFEFCERANGRVLIAGLGIGLIINEILTRDNVDEIIVIEKYQDVIDLVLPKIKHKKLTVICADIFEWKPEKSQLFDTIYFDIWPEISEDNLDEIKLLHNRFKFKLNRENESAWMGSWMADFLRARRRQERSSRYW